MSIVLGVVADDFTGATDIANNLVRSGMKCILLIGVPGSKTDITEADAVVVALKSRSCDVNQAINDSVSSVSWLKDQGAKQIFFKYCSTFDSTEKGNIGPVSDALMKLLVTKQTVFVPAFPENGRTVYQGNLFVGDRLLNESGMEQHPLNPMKDSNVVRLLKSQTQYGVGLINRQLIEQGAQAVRTAMEDLRSEDKCHIVCDAINDGDLEVLATAVVDLPLVTGGSGLAKALPHAYRARGWLQDRKQPGYLSSDSGAQFILSGSCSRMTLAQLDHFLKDHQGFPLNPLKLASEGEAHIAEALTFATNNMKRGTPAIIYASANPQTVEAAQKSLGREKSGELVENALGELAKALVALGTSRLIVAGGESSGAVVSALDIAQLRVGDQIDPGVPWTQTIADGTSRPLLLALKSGNFGTVDFFSKAFKLLDNPNTGEH
ncbi:3-oxo-tetronate kinase [Saccharospirillum alexandrii]|uniref:3-oxo-tetronate kinase n=1 Tax=Saccharospirillum alexandrii TaxID=2448477 RepID=UPI000FD89D6B|nr:3-oxo-tetronate kinase [Saccharospirillum alexandrii]